MTAIELQKPKPFWERHLGALIVGGFALLLAVVVVLQALEEGDIARWLGEVSEEGAYALCFLFVWFDAIVPIFPGETTLSAASTVAAEGGELELALVMVAGALGAIVGDSSLFWIARKNAGRVQGQLDRALENPNLRAGWMWHRLHVRSSAGFAVTWVAEWNPAVHSFGGTSPMRVRQRELGWRSGPHYCGTV